MNHTDWNENGKVLQKHVKMFLLTQAPFYKVYYQYKYIHAKKLKQLT